ncbi:MAG: GAF domain-containing protein [Spirochaetes bacterium]|nr:GAF domain-containing protein [Spirochaetota bacterium]
MCDPDCLAVARLVCEKIPLLGLYAGCHRVLRKRMPAENMFIALVEGPEGLRFPYYFDVLEPENPLQLFVKEGLTAYVIDAGRLVWTGKDPGILDRIKFVGPRPVDWVGIPLKDRRGGVFGILAVQTYDPGSSYSADDVEFIEFTALQISLAVQLHFYDRDRAITKIIALVDESTDIQDLYPRIHEIAMDLIPVAERNFIIARIDRNAGVFRPVYWRDEKDDYEAMHWPLNEGFSGYICGVTGMSFIYENGMKSIPPGIIPIGAPPTYWLGAPLRGGGEIIGVVVIQTYDPSEPITREDENILNSLCPHIAQAIERTEFFEKMHKGGLLKPT